MVVFQLITTSCLLSYLVMPPPQWSGDRGLLFAWSNAWLLLVTRRSCLFQEPSGKSMVNVKVVTASLYFLPTSPLLCCPCWHHGGWRSTWGVWFKALILLLIAWCDAVSAVRQTLEEQLFHLTFLSRKLWSWGCVTWWWWCFFPKWGR